MLAAPHLGRLLLAALCAALLVVAVWFVSLWSLLGAADAGSGRAGMDAAGGGFTASAIALALLLAGVAGLAGASIAGHRAKDALRQARADRRALVGLLEVWHWQTDREHRIVQWLAPAGAPAHAAPGREPLALWERLGVDASEPLQGRMHSQAPFSDVPARGGDTHWLLRAAPRFDAEGRFDGYIGTARIDAKPDTQAPGKVARPSTEGADAAAFSYTVSHDLRAPVRVVEGFTRIVKEDYGRLLDRVGIDHLDRVLGAAARMNNMIDALLALSKLAEQPLRRQPVDLSQCAAWIVEDLRRAAPERAVEVRIESGLVAEGDPTLLRVALENLLGNAWKYTSRTSQARICFESSRHDGQTVYAMRDNGAGFDMRYADRLFGVFQRLHGASDFPGTGVGLASVRRIVARHGGTIRAESEPGRGASFYFTLR